MVHPTNSLSLCFQPIRLSSFSRLKPLLGPGAITSCRPVIHRLAQLTLSLFCTTGGWTHLSSLPFRSDSSKTRVRALARLPCMCPDHVVGLPGLAPASLPVTFVGRLTCQLTFLLYLAASRAPSVKPDSLVSHT
jgi:hypothetical protein